MYVLGLDNSVSAGNLGCAKKRSKAGRFDDPKDHSSKKSINTIDLFLKMKGKFKSIPEKKGKSRRKKKKGTIYKKKKGISLLELKNPFKKNITLHRSAGDL